MYVVLTVKVSFYSVVGRNRAYNAYRYLCRFLHNVAKRSCYLYLSVSVKYQRFNFKHISANFGISETVYRAYLIIFGDTLGQKLSPTKVFLYVFSLNGQLCKLFIFNKSLCRFSYYVGKCSFKISHTGFFGVVIYYLNDSSVVYSEHLFAHTVARELLGKQVVFSYGKLFCFCIGVQVDYLHSVKQGAGNGIEPVCRCYKETVGEIEWHLNKVVSEVFVLLRVEHLEKCRGGIAVRISCDFIYLIE